MFVLKKLSKLTLAAATFAVVAFFIIVFIFLFKFRHSTQHDFKNTNIYDQEQADSLGLPVRLKIPVINIDAAVESLGRTSQGDMDVPKGPDDVAWYDLGTLPGESGSAVIAGHYGTWKNGQGSVFNNLNKLNQGDKIYIEEEKGKTITFVVRERRSYDPKADASGVFISNDGKSHLNLITCEGSWDKNSKSYSQRLVIFADKEGE